MYYCRYGKLESVSTHHKSQNVQLFLANKKTTAIFLLSPHAQNKDNIKKTLLKMNGTRASPRLLCLHIYMCIHTHDTYVYTQTHTHTYVCIYLYLDIYIYVLYFSLYMYISLIRSRLFYFMNVVYHLFFCLTRLRTRVKHVNTCCWTSSHSCHRLTLIARYSTQRSVNAPPTGGVLCFWSKAAKPLLLSQLVSWRRFIQTSPLRIPWRDMIRCSSQCPDSERCPPQ